MILLPQNPKCWDYKCGGNSAYSSKRVSSQNFATHILGLPQVISNPFLTPTDKEMIVTCIHETLGIGSVSMQGMLTKCSACWIYGNSSGELPEGAAAREAFLQAAAEHKTKLLHLVELPFQICLPQPHYRHPFKFFIFPSVK